MENYDPSIAPDPVEWQTLDENERINLVEDFHLNSGEEMPESGFALHSHFHVLVENQIAMDYEPVPETIARLTRQGLTRHEAIHAVAAIVCENTYDLLKGNEEKWNPKKYRRRLEKLTAKRWKKGKW